ncbi:MAG: nucleotidyl transferase AbiEii/AbiGii toxin family protein [Boseongicola sp. SB0677_bin_26]|nr:nucleotidyl transferase AbiEii/AbiGii toxin family protein [Boseongicola sp. SB0665_bin_10]MYG27081.1 nucleotidyl transferase AbiEii/AbiGii toxin family protein [Boseongicola sp. SB0677_bin_26]
MKLVRREVEDLAEERGLRTDMLESMLRLYDVLNSFASDDVIAPRMALKGGTALSAFHGKLPRRSFDIDINYVGELDYRRHFDDRFVSILLSKGYRLGATPPGGSAKWTFRYQSLFDSESSLFIDVNYRERFPLFGVSRLSSAPLGECRARDVPVLDVHEVAGSKLKALVVRQRSRDLFDADVIIDMHGLDWEKVRLANVVHGAWQVRHDWRDFSSAFICGDEREGEEAWRNAFQRVLCGIDRTGAVQVCPSRNKEASHWDANVAVH